jgi:hypothetical protein
MLITQALLQQRGERDNRELSERAARRCQPQRQGAAHGGGLAPDGGQFGPQSRRRHADAREHASQDDQDAIVGKAQQQQTDGIECPPVATVLAVRKRSAKLPAKGAQAPINSMENALANDRSSRPTPRSVPIGF